MRYFFYHYNLFEEPHQFKTFHLVCSLPPTKFMHQYILIFQEYCFLIFREKDTYTLRVWKNSLVVLHVLNKGYQNLFLTKILLTYVNSKKLTPIFYTNKV